MTTWQDIERMENPPEETFCPDYTVNFKKGQKIIFESPKGDSEIENKMREYIKLNNIEMAC